MSSTKTHTAKNEHADRMSWLVAAVLMICAALDIFNRAAYGGRPRGYIGYIADHPLWTLIFFATSLAVALSMVLERGRHATMSAATGVLVTWSFFLTWWALEIPPPPVSLLGPVLAMGHGLMAFFLSRYWAMIEVERASIRKR